MERSSSNEEFYGIKGGVSKFRVAAAVAVINSPRRYTERVIEVVAKVGARWLIKEDPQPFLPEGLENPLPVPQHCSRSARLLLALEGETERAATELAEVRRLIGDDRYSSIARLKAIGRWGAPKTRALFEATYFAGLRKARMPEE